MKRAGLRVARVRDCMVRRDGKAGEIHGKVFIAVKPTDARRQRRRRPQRRHRRRRRAASPTHRRQHARCCTRSSRRRACRRICSTPHFGRSAPAAGSPSADRRRPAASPSSVGGGRRACFARRVGPRGCPLSSGSACSACRWRDGVHRRRAAGSRLPASLCSCTTSHALCAQLVSEAAVMQAEVGRPVDFVWSLSRAAADGAADAIRRVGDNFGKPHATAASAVPPKSDGRMASLGVLVPLAEVAATRAACASCRGARCALRPPAAPATGGVRRRRRPPRH